MNSETTNRVQLTTTTTTTTSNDSSNLTITLESPPPHPAVDYLCDDKEQIQHILESVKTAIEDCNFSSEISSLIIEYNKDE